MIFDDLKNNLIITDEEFDTIYPERARNLTQRHWTPVDVAIQAAEFLADNPDAKVLDIGSGVGKFCMIGAAVTEGYFTGVEYRDYFFHLSEFVLECYGLPRVKFIHSNITNIKFQDYNGIYFFNSFQENIDDSAIIDPTVETGEEQYHLYTGYVFDQLSLMPIGTRLATYWGKNNKIPKQYTLLFSDFNGELKCWEKTE